MKLRSLYLILFSLIPLTSIAEKEPPDEALKYHRALLKRPDNATLLDRFFNAWLDEQPIETLDAFLKARAEEHGGRDLAVLAQHQLRRGHENEALETLGKAIQALPDEPFLPMERAQILLRRLEFDAARQDFAKAANGDDPAIALEASKAIGKSFLREGKPEKAIEAWDALLAANPGDEILLEDLVEAAAAEGEIKQATAYSQKLIDATSDPYKKTLRQLRRGDLLADAGRHDDAIDTYSKTLDQTGEGSWLEREILAQIDKAYRQQDRLADLKTKLTELVKANPRRLLIHRQLAKIEVAQGEVDSAIGRFREVLKRSPGNLELREEFVRLLTEAEKFKDAATELEKLIELDPDNAGLHLQMADLRHRQNDPDATLSALKKAHGILGDEEASGVRIASLMFQYELDEPGETLLKSLTEADDASSAPAEALASQYARTDRKDDALAILKPLGESDQLDVVLRATASISALGEKESAYRILSGKAESFSQEPRFLTAITSAALATKHHEEAVRHAVKLVRASTRTPEISKNIPLALRAINAAEQPLKWLETLEKQPERSPAETCLLAALAESLTDFETVAKVMAADPSPITIRFHASLLDRRGDLNQAIDVLAQLADTDAGRTTSYFKQMTQLQRAAGLTEDALATVERWKQSNPGDKTSWVVGSEILRENLRTDEAVRVLRRAVSRFDQDTALAANLAQLHEENAQPEEANAIYWQLYNAAEKPAEQVRWAASLAQIAYQTGRTEELEQKFRERARSNRRSIGPLLAQAELATITNNQGKRRDLLLDAIRLQPENVDLRLQVANFEEQSGNPERVIAILKEAVDRDTTGRLRSALAQAYLRQGQTLKGMRELQKIVGQQANDPRVVERSAASLASSGLYEEAIRFLQDTLPTGGDWRSQYLLAIMLEHDGREADAIPIFKKLLRAETDIPGLAPKKTSPSPYAAYFDMYPDAVLDIFQMMNSTELAYAHRQAGGRGMGMRFFNQNPGSTRVHSFVLPDTPQMLHTFTRIHLGKLDASESTEASFLDDLANAAENNTDFFTLLEKYPEQPGLFEIALMFSERQGASIEPEKLRKLLEQRENLAPIFRLQANLLIAHRAENDDPIWQKITTIAADVATQPKDPETINVGFVLFQKLIEEGAQFPEKVREELSDSLLAIAAKFEADDFPFGDFKLMATQAVGTEEQWIVAVNERVREFRQKNPRGKLPDPTQNSFQRMMSMNRGNTTPIALPQAASLSLSSLPSDVLSMIQPESQMPRAFGLTPTTPNGLLKKLDDFDSPALRAWIAIQANDPDAIEKTLAATPTDIESTDFKTLRAYHAVIREDYPTAYRLFSELRPTYNTNRSLIQWLNTSLLAIADQMTDDQRADLIDELRPLLIHANRTLSPEIKPQLAQLAEKFGLERLAKRLNPTANPTVIPGTGSIAQIAQAKIAAQRQSHSSGNAQIERMKKFAAEEKYEAAALEAHNLIRQARQNSHRYSYEFRRIKQEITPEVLTELFKRIDPGDSKSLTKRLEYADICAQFGKPEIAVKVLDELHRERPDDQRVAAKLAFLLPPDERDRAIKILTTAASSDELVTTAQTKFESFSYQDDNTTQAIALFSTVAEWLARTDPQTLKSANLSWVAHYANRFYQGYYTDNLRGLSDPPSEDAKKAEHYPEFTATAKTLATAMLRHPAIAEEGFRLLGASKAWEIPANKMDEHARQIFTNATLDRNNLNHYVNAPYFVLQLGNSSSGGGEQYEKHSSVNWITTRLAAAKSPDAILPPDYLEKLNRQNPGVGQLISALAKLDSLEQLESLWDSEPFANQSSPFVVMCRHAILKRAATIPGAADFFLKRIRDVKSNLSARGIFNASDSDASLFSSAISASSHTQKTEKLAAILSAISQKMFGENFDLESPKDPMATYQMINAFEQILTNAKLDPAGTVRVHRTLYKLGIPAGQNEYQITQTFQQIKITSTEEAEETFASFGWLDDVETWEPTAAILVEANHSGRQVSFQSKEVFLIPEVYRYMSINIQGTNLMQFLENRDPQTFGNLITAASMTDGTKRAQLTEKAFTAAAPQLAKMTPERARAFTPLLEWLPDSALENLPASFKKTAEKANRAKLEKLHLAADEFLNSPSNNNPHNNALDQTQDLVIELLPLDFDKAVKIFLEAEKRFTASLSSGGRLSSYTYNSTQIIERDEHLNELITDSDSPLSKNPELALAFLSAIANSDAASRFSYSPSWRNALAAEIGESIYQAADDEKSKRPHWLRALRATTTYPEPLRPDAQICLANHLLYDSNRSNQIKPATDRKALANMKDIPANFKNIRTLAIGIKAWNDDSPKAREATKKSLLSITENADSIPALRLQLFTSTLSKAPAILDDPEIATEFASLFETYAQGERSAINPFTVNLIETLVKITPTDANKPALTRLNAALWDNANNPKTGGHPEISQRIIPNLILFTSTVGDDTNSMRLVKSARGQLRGNVAFIATLINHGSHKLAAEFNGNTNQPFDRTGNHKFPPYDRHFERQLQAFRKSDGFNPRELILFESQLKGVGPAVTGKNAPVETETEREQRLAKAYKANPPNTRVEQIHTLSSLTRDSHTMAILLKDELIALRDRLDLTKTLDQWEKGDPNPPAGMSSTDMPGAKSVIFRQAAFLEFLDGDLSGLNDIVDALADRSAYDPSHDGDRNYWGGYLERIMQSAPLWIAEAIHRDQTGAFDRTFDPFAKLSLISDSRKELSSWPRAMPPTVAQFFAHWNGQGEQFDKLKKKINHEKTLNFFQKDRWMDIHFFTYLGWQHLLWKHPSFQPTQRSFITTIITRPEMENYYKPLRSGKPWHQKVALVDTYHEFAENPPEGILPTAYTLILYFRAEHELKNNNDKKGIPFLTKALEVCPTDKAWNNTYYNLSTKLMNSLVKTKQIDQATQILPTIETARFNKKQTKNWKKITAKIPSNDPEKE